MADINATDLTQETLSSLDGAEQFIMFDTAEGKRATVQAVGEYVLSKLTSSLMGSSQTVANAFTALKTRTPVLSGAYATALANNTDLNTITDIGSYGASSSAIAATLVNSPVSVAFIMYVEDVTQASSETSNYRYRRQRIIAMTPTERDEYTRGFNTSNGGTSWTFQEWKKKVTRAEFDNLQTGGRNLIVNTLNAVDTPVNSRPHLLESTLGASGRGTCTAAEHGLRFTTDSGNVGNWQYFRFGSSSTSSVNSNLMGLEVGKDYTWSFDIEYKLLSGRNETSTDLKLEAQLWTTRGTSTQFGRTVYQTIHEYKASDLTDRGTVLTDHVEFTFTVPDNATRLYLDAKMSNTDIKADYLVGDYIELRNIKLEKGNRASDWSPAPEDYESWHVFNDTSLLTTQVEEIASSKVGLHFTGFIASYGKAEATGMPANSNCYLDIYIATASYIKIEARPVSTNAQEVWCNTKINGSWTGWVKQPTRTEIDSKLGFFAPTIITNNSDLNTLTTPGSYYADTPTGITNTPSGLSSGVYRLDTISLANVTRADGTYVRICQIITDFYGNVWRRGARTRATANVYDFDAWKKVTTSEDLTPTTLTLTYTSNSYVSETDFNRLRVFKIGSLYVCNGNFSITNNMPTSTSDVTIGTISGWSSTYPINVDVPMQNGSGVAYISISTTGTVTLTNLSGVTIKGWCKFNASTI